MQTRPGTADTQHGTGRITSARADAGERRRTIARGASVVRGFFVQGRIGRCRLVLRDKRLVTRLQQLYLTAQ